MTRAPLYLRLFSRSDQPSIKTEPQATRVENAPMLTATKQQPLTLVYSVSDDQPRVGFQIAGSDLEVDWDGGGFRDVEPNSGDAFDGCLEHVYDADDIVDLSNHTTEWEDENRGTIMTGKRTFTVRVTGSIRFFTVEPPPKKPFHRRTRLLSVSLGQPL